MKMNKAALALAIASSFGTMSGAQAAVTLGDSTTATVFAKEISLQNTTIDFINDGGNDNRLVVNIPAIKNYVTNSNNNYFVKVALLDGATFAGTAVLNCSLSGGGVGGVVQTETAKVTQNGNKDDALVTFSISTGYRIDSTGCSLLVKGGANAADGGTAYYKITDKVDQRMSAVIEYKDGIDSKVTAYNGTFISFVNGFDVSASTYVLNSTVTAANAVISVQDASLKFAADLVVSQTQAFVGSVAYNTADDTNAVVLSPFVTANIGSDSVAETLSVTIDSPALAGVDTVTLNDASNKACDAASPVGTAQKPGGATSVTFADLTPANLKTGVNVCITIDGLTAVPAGQFTVTINGEDKVNGNTVLATPDFGEANRPLYNLKKNGSAHRVLNIPPAGVADKAFIRLYNVSSFAGTVLGTMRDSTGALIGTAGTVVTTLNPREVKVVNADTLKTLFGDWTGRSRLFLEADIDELRVQSLMRSSDVLENMSGKAVD
jgi:hypothetical protein